MGEIPAAGDVVTVRILSTCAAEPTINDLSFEIVNPAATWWDQFNQVSTDLNGAIGLVADGDWVDQRSTAFNTYGLQMIDVRPGTSPMVQGALAAQGSLADDVMPPNDSLCITLRTNVKGRTGRGRMYLNGFPEGSSNGGYWEAAAQDSATAIANDLAGAFSEMNLTRNMTWVVVSRYEFGVKREIPAVTPVTSYTVHNEVRSLRRRAIGVRISRRTTAP